MSQPAPVDLLAVGPHPDDLELSCGGWLALAAERGQRVILLDLTAGELATNGTVAGRAAEAQAAAEVLGVAGRVNLGLPDGGLAAGDPEQVAALVAAIRVHRPRLLLAPHVSARHPDHAEAGHLARRAAFFAGVRRHRPELGAPHRPVRLVAYPQRHEVAADFVVDVSAVAERKARAIACHASQFGPGGEPTLINRPLGLRALEVRDRYWGAAIGVEAGEPYLLGAPVPISDPVAHFRTHAEVPVLVPPRERS